MDYKTCCPWLSLASLLGEKRDGCMDCWMNGGTYRSTVIQMHDSMYAGILKIAMISYALHEFILRTCLFAHSIYACFMWPAQWTVRLARSGIWFSHPTYFSFMYKGRDMVQAVSSLPVTRMVCVWSRGNLCGVCGEKIGTWIVLSPDTWIFFLSQSFLWWSTLKMRRSLIVYAIHV